MKRKKNIIVYAILVCICLIIVVVIKKNWENKSENTINTSTNETSIEVENNVNTVLDNVEQINENRVTSIGNCYINSVEDVELHDVDGMLKNYQFKYNNEVYTAVYTTDNWHINDSYKITNEQDIILICEALISEHKVHGKDMVSYRTAEDMAYEWLQHNLAYTVLPEDSTWKNNAKDVDLDSADQGKSLIEMYNSRVN